MLQARMENAIQNILCKCKTGAIPITLSSYRHHPHQVEQPERNATVSGVFQNLSCIVWSDDINIQGMAMLLDI